MQLKTRIRTHSRSNNHHFIKLIPFYTIHNVEEEEELIKWLSKQYKAAHHLYALSIQTSSVIWISGVIDLGKCNHLHYFTVTAKLSNSNNFVTLNYIKLIWTKQGWLCHERISLCALIFASLLFSQCQSIDALVFRYGDMYLEQKKNQMNGLAIWTNMNWELFPIHRTQQSTNQNVNETETKSALTEIPSWYKQKISVVKTRRDFDSKTLDTLHELFSA